MSTSQALSGFAADAPRYGTNPVNAYYALNQANTVEPVQSVNALTGDVVIQVNGVPVVPSGQNLNIVASPGVASITAGAIVRAGAVSLTSTDGSVVFTSVDDPTAPINLKASVPPTNTSIGSPSTQLVLAGAGEIGPTTPYLTIGSLIPGKTYLLNVSTTIYTNGVTTGWSNVGSSYNGLVFLFANAGTGDVAPIPVGSSTLGLPYAGQVPAVVITSIQSELTQAPFNCNFSATVTAPANGRFSVFARHNGTITGGTIVVNLSGASNDTFIQATLLD